MLQIFLFVGNVLSLLSISATATQHTVNLKDYANPTNFWPFSYATEENEIIQNIVPFVYGKTYFEITGKGNGHLKFPVSKSSAELMKTSQLNCAEAMCSLTVSFWTRLTDIDAAKSSTHKDPLKISILSTANFVVSYILKGGKSYLQVLSKTYMTESPILIGNWYHILVKVGGEAKLEVYLNGEQISDMVANINSLMPSKDLIMLGEYSPGKDVLNIFQNAYFYIGALAIWKRFLTKKEQSDIYLAELGTFENDTSCRLFNDMFVVEWKVPVDPYQQIKSVVIKTWPIETRDNKTYTIRLPNWNSANKASELSILPEQFDLSQKYHMRVEVTINNNHVLNVPEGVCEILKPVQEKSISIKSFTPFSISVIWKKRYETYASFLIRVTCEGVYIDKSSTHEMKTKTLHSLTSLNTSVESLKPSSNCKVLVERTFKKSQIKHSYFLQIKTRSLISLVRYSVLSFEIVERTWNAVKIKFNFHPEFYNYEMEYIFYYKSLDLPTKKGSLRRKIPKQIADFTLTVQKLKEDSYNEIDCEVLDLGMASEGLRMKDPIVIKTRERFPPPRKLEVIQKNSSYIKITYQLEEGLIVSKHNIKFVYFAIRKDDDVEEMKVHKISIDESEIEFGELQESTVYDVYGSTGDENKHHEMKKLLTLQTEKKILTTRKPTPYVESTCQQQRHRGIDWPSSAIDTMVEVPCPSGFIGNATRQCIEQAPGIARWEAPDMKNCKSKKLLSIKLLPAKSLTKELDSYLNQSAEIYSGDLLQVINMMEIIKTADTKNPVDGSESLEVLEGVANIASNLLDKKAEDSWNSLPQKVRSVKASALLDVADTIIGKSVVTQNTTQVISTEKLTIEITKITEENSKKMDIKLPKDLFETDESRLLAVAEYKGIEELLGVPESSSLSGKRKISSLNSKVKSISVVPSMSGHTFKEPFIFTIPFKKGLVNDSKPNCVYWENSVTGDGGYWSDSGCSVREWDNSTATCQCNHLTNFAILMSISEDVGNENEGEDALILKMITCLGLSISLVALFASFLTFALIKKIRSLRNIIHQHLCISLFIGEFIFLFGVEQTQYKIGCQVIAVALHYFFLVAFLMMGLEGLVLYLMLVRVYKSRNSSDYGSLRYLLICWALPFVVIIVNICIDRNAYGSNGSHCWLSVKNYFVWSFVGPVLAIIMFNFVILIMTFRIMMAKGKNRNSFVQDIWFWSKGCGLLLSVLGISWVLGLFYIDQNTVVFAYAFNIINSFQGLGIFVFHCLCDPRVLKEYHNFICCVRRKEARLYRAPSRSSSTGSRRMFFRNSARMMLRLKSFSERDNSTDKDSSLNRHEISSSTQENSVGLLVGRGKS